jgi:hypothetical protein
VPYPAELATALRSALALDGTGRLLDACAHPEVELCEPRLVAPTAEECLDVHVTSVCPCHERAGPTGGPPVPVDDLWTTESAVDSRSGDRWLSTLQHPACC